MFNSDDFQSIDENNNTFVSIEKENEEEQENSVNTFVLGLPEWDLEPLYESVKRRGNE
jgi:hypothetical protein